MLVRLLPEQVSSNWSEIRPAIEASLPPIVGDNYDRMNNILKAVMLGDIIVWVSVDKDKNINAIVSTTFSFDVNTGTNALLIFSVFSYDGIDRVSWTEGVNTLKKFAAGNNCNMMTAYTDVPSIINYVESIGGSANYRFVTIPIRRKS